MPIRQRHRGSASSDPIPCYQHRFRFWPCRRPAHLGARPDSGPGADVKVGPLFPPLHQALTSLRLLFISFLNYFQSCSQSLSVCVLASSVSLIKTNRMIFPTWGCGSAVFICSRAATGRPQVSSTGTGTGEGRGTTRSSLDEGWRCCSDPSPNNLAW